MKATFILASTVAALLAISCSRQGSPPASNDTPAQQQPAVQVSTAHDVLPKAAGFNWHAGDTSSFTIEVAFAFGKPTNDAASVPDPANGGLVIRGNYHLGVLSVERDIVTLAAALSEASLLRSGQRSPIFEELINSTPAILTLKKDGTVQEIAFPGDIPAEDRQILRAIFGWEFQARPGETSWQSTETNPGGDGSFLATYSANNDGSVAKVRSVQPGSHGPVPAVKASHFNGKAGRLWLDYLRGEEGAVLMWDGKPVGESLVRVALERFETASRPAHFESLLRTAPRPGEFTAAPGAAASGRTSASEQTRIQILQQKYRSIPYEVPFRALQRVANTGSHADAVPVLHALRDMLTVRPDCAPRIAESLKSEITPELSALLAHSLELANTEATQGTLADILSHPDEYSPTVLAQAIVAAGGLGPLKDQRVSESLNEMLMYVGKNPSDYVLNDAALFSLGRLSVANAQLREPLISALAPRLIDGDNQDGRTALLALANGRLESPEIVASAERLLRSPEPQTRATALAYLEQLPQLTPQQTQQVIGLLKDSDSSVRLQAVATLSPANERAPGSETITALETIASNEAAHPDVQLAARNALARLATKPSETSHPQ